MDRLTARYLVETPLAIEAAATVLAGEQSTGTFVEAPGETADRKQRFGAQVENITPLADVPAPSLPGSRHQAGPCAQAEVTISWPVENFGANLPALVSTLQGNLYELAQVSGLKLLDFNPPASLVAQYPGPSFGVAGTRQLAGVEDRPIFGAIIKPSVGLSPAETATMVAELCEAGIDFIKDDELMANPPHSPFDQRLRAVMRVISEHADRTGKRVLYAFNISDELDAMLRHYERIVAAGGAAAMVSLNSVGLSAVKKVCDQGMLAIHGHRNGWGMLSRHPALGMEFPAYQTLWRLAGVDQLHVNGIQNKFWESDDSVVRSIKACQAPLFDQRPVMPVLSSGQWGGQAFETYRRTRSIDFLYLAGGGIAAHPGGLAAGVKALGDAWQAAVSGRTMADAARESSEFSMSVDKFSKSNN